MARPCAEHCLWASQIRDAVTPLVAAQQLYCWTSKTKNILGPAWCARGCEKIKWACGVVVPHPLSMRGGPGPKPLRVHARECEGVSVRKSCAGRNPSACNRVCKQARRARANVLRGRDACPQRNCARCLHARAAPLVRDCPRPRGNSKVSALAWTRASAAEIAHSSPSASVVAP